MQQPDDAQMLKDNALKLAQHHKKTCGDPECDISLFQLRRLLERAGIPITQEERRILI